MYGKYSREMTIHLFINRVGHNRAYTVCIQCIYAVLGRETTKYTVIYGVYIQF